MANNRRFRFGMSRSRTGSLAEWTEFARRTEAAGFDVLLVADHLGALSPVVALQAAADVTEQIRLGTFVLNNDFRHPTIVAQETASLDMLSDGRYELGIGAGWNKPEYDAAGLTYDRPAIRIRRLEESVVILKRLFAGDTVTFEGDHYTVNEHPLEPLPPQGSGLPVLIGGNGTRLLGVAGRLADIVGFTGFTHSGNGVDFRYFTRDGFADRVSVVAEAAGNRFSDLELNVLIQRLIITDDPESVAADLAAQWASEGDGDTPDAATILGSPFIQIGSPSSIAHDLRLLRAETGASYFTVFDGRSDGAEGVIAELAGE